jgi:hypothetical protein
MSRKLALIAAAVLAMAALTATGLAVAGSDGGQGNQAGTTPTGTVESPAKADDDDNGEGKNDSDGSPRAANAEKAKNAAVRVAGGGTVLDVEQGDDGNPGWYEVEIRKDDGTEVKVQLDNNFNVRTGGDEESNNDGPNEQEGGSDD